MSRAEESQSSIARDSLSPTTSSTHQVTPSQPRRMESADALPKPKLVTGGCLCGAIRYRVDFPQDHDYPRNVSPLPPAERDKC